MSLVLPCALGYELPLFFGDWWGNVFLCGVCGAGWIFDSLDDATSCSPRSHDLVPPLQVSWSLEDFSLDIQRGAVVSLGTCFDYWLHPAFWASVITSSSNGTDMAVFYDLEDDDCASGSRSGNDLGSAQSDPRPYHTWNQLNSVTRGATVGSNSTDDKSTAVTANKLAAALTCYPYAMIWCTYKCVNTDARNPVLLYRWPPRLTLMISMPFPRPAKASMRA